MADEKSGTMAVHLPGVNFEMLAKQVIAEKIAEGLFKADDIVRGLISEALSQRVQSDGTPDRYNNARDGMTWLEFVVKDHLKKAVTATVKQRIVDMTPRIEKAVEKALIASADTAAKVLVEDFTKRATESYAPQIEVTFKAPTRSR